MGTLRPQLENGLGWQSPVCPDSWPRLLPSSSPNRLVAGSPSARQEQVGSWCPVPRVTRPRLRPAPCPGQHSCGQTGRLAPIHPGTFLAQPLFFFFFLVTLSPTPCTLTPLFLKNALSLPRGSLWAEAPGGKCGLDFLEHAELESQPWEEGSGWRQSNSRCQHSRVLLSKGGSWGPRSPMPCAP